MSVYIYIYIYIYISTVRVGAVHGTVLALAVLDGLGADSMVLLRCFDGAASVLVWR